MKNSFGTKRLSMKTVDKYNRMANNESFVGSDSHEDTSMSAGQGVSRSTEPYVLNIANAGAGIETAIIFGRNRFGGQANFGSGANITISMGVSAVPYEQLLQQSASSPFEVVKMRLSSTSVSQLDQSFTYVKTDSNGESANRVITVSSYQSPNQFVTTLRDIDYRFQVEGNRHLEYPVLPGQEVTMSIFINAKIDISDPLVGKSPITEYDNIRVRSFK